MFEHRQHVGQRHRAALVIDLEVQLGGLRLQRAVQVDAQPAVLHGGLDPLDVVHRGLGGERLAVAGREGVGVAHHQVGAGLVAAGVHQRVLELVGPVARRLHQPRLDLSHRIVRRPAGLGLDDEVDARQHALGELRGEGGAGAVQRRLQDRLHAPPQFRVVAVARHEDQAGGEAVERVPAHEQRQPLPLLQVQDAERGVVQLLDSGLEQLVARVGLQDVEQRLAVVAPRVEAGALDHRGDLAADEGDVARAAVVGGGGEQPDDQPLADDPPLGVEALQQHHVHVHRPVHGGTRVGLGDHQRAGRAQELAHVGRQRVVVAQPLEDGDLVVAQDAQRAARQQVQRRLAAVRRRLEAVLAVAEVGEVVVVHPAQERLGLRHLVGGQRGAHRAGLVQRLVHLGAHRAPVRHRGADLVQHALQPGAHALQRRGVGAGVDLDVHVRLGRRLDRRRLRLVQVEQPAGLVPLRPHHRVDDEVDGEPLAVQLRGDRVDQERHVVVDDLHHRARRLPAVLLDAGVVDAHGGAAGPALLPPLPHGDGGAVELVGGCLHDVVRRHVGVELPHEPLRQTHPAAVQASPHLTDHLLGQFVLELLGTECHGCPPQNLFYRCCKGS